MTSKKKWKEGSISDGFVEIELSSWRDLHEYVMSEMLEFGHYVWRGQRDASWGLQTGFDRAMQFKKKSTYELHARKHLSNFKMASRGRRGPSPAKIEDENDWWALAQHYGLATPLLDWTASPFVALYFAFEKEQAPSSEKRAIWAIGAVEAKNGEIKKSHSGSAAAPLLKFLRPLQDDNSRLVSQSGLFTKAPYGETVESWVKQNFEGEKSIMHLMKITMPNRDRPDCLKILNKMNINHTSLFPDLYGSSIHCNKQLQMDGY